MSSRTDETRAPTGDATTCDAFLGGRIRAFQPRKGPRTAIDALLLAAAIPAREGHAERVLEAGQGSGVASLALAARISDAHVTGVEIQPALCALAKRNAELNGMQDRVNVAQADLTAAHRLLPQALPAPGSFHHVAANPPYMDAGQGRSSPDPATAIAHSTDACALEAWVRFLSRMAAPGGTVTLIHRADALDRLLALLQGRFGALTVFPLFPREGEAATRVIVQGIKGSRAPMSIRRGMVLHAADGFTPEAERILKAGEALPIAPGGAPNRQSQGK